MTEGNEPYESTCLDAIRAMTAVLDCGNVVNLINRMALVNLIVRGMQGDAEHDFVKEETLKATGIILTDLEAK